jgi:16S rRNA G966 N2-methylase RsmD
VYVDTKTTGWSPTCSCNADTVPATVLDLFAGSGTVGVVAQKLGRRAVLIDANEDYLKLAKERIGGIALPMF